MNELARIAAFSVTPSRPFDFDATFHKPDHFTSRDNLWIPGIRWQAWFSQGEQLGLKFSNTGTREAPEILIDVYGRHDPGDDFLETLASKIRYRYNLDMDLGPFYRMARKDPLLRPIVRRLRGMRPGHPNSLYEYLIIGIVLQNATVRRSIQMLASLLEHLGTELSIDGKRLLCFWKPGSLERVSEDDLRTLKLGYRARSIKRIDEEFARERVNEAKLRGEDLEDCKKSLLSLYGVGPATIGYLLTDVFHHWDFIDHIPRWEQKIYSKLFFDRDPAKPLSIETIRRFFERYRPFRALAIHYVWEDLWWTHTRKPIPWLERLIRR